MAERHHRKKISCKMCFPVKQKYLKNSNSSSSDFADNEKSQKTIPRPRRRKFGIGKVFRGSGQQKTVDLEGESQSTTEESCSSSPETLRREELGKDPGTTMGKSSGNGDDSPNFEHDSEQVSEKSQQFSGANPDDLTIGEPVENHEDQLPHLHAAEENPDYNTLLIQLFESDTPTDNSNKIFETAEAAEPPLTTAETLDTTTTTTTLQQTVEAPLESSESALSFWTANYNNSRSSNTSLRIAATTSRGASANERTFKILVIGDAATGKTSFINRLTTNSFPQNYRPTIGVDFSSRTYHWDERTSIRLHFWDIAGQERFTSMTRVFYKEAMAAFIVFDVSRDSTFTSVRPWKADLDSKVQLPDGSHVPCLLIANKCDQLAAGFVEDSVLEDFCRSSGFSGWFLTSVLENFNVEESLEYLIKKIMERDTYVPSYHVESIRLTKEGKAQTKKACC